MTGKKKSNEHQEMDAAWQHVASSNQGRKVLREIIEMSGFMHSPFHGQTNQTIKNIGMQSVGQHVFQSVKARAPDQFLHLIKEDLDNA